MPALVVYITLDMTRKKEKASIFFEMMDYTSDCDSTSKNISLPTHFDSNTDVVSFLTGVLLSPDHRVRIWFSQFVKSALRVCLLLF